MANLTSLSIGTDTGTKELPAAPANVKDGPNGGVVVDPSVAPPAPPAAKPTYEELEKSYTELRTKMSKEGAPKAEETPAAPAATPPTPLTTEQAEKAVVDAGLDLSKLEAEYTANGGKLSEDSLKALEAKGLSREQVNSYIAGQEALASNLRTSFATIAGGEEKLKAVLAWAQTNLTASESAAYNAALDTGNVETAKMLMEGINQRYVRVNGSEPALISAGNGTRVGDVRPFTSSSEIATAFSDPRYANGDRAYHAEVQARMAVTTL